MYCMVREDNTMYDFCRILYSITVMYCMCYLYFSSQNIQYFYECAGFVSIYSGSPSARKLSRRWKIEPLEKSQIKASMSFDDDVDHDDEVWDITLV